MSNDQTAKAIVEDVLRQLQGKPLGSFTDAPDTPDRGNVQRVALKTLDELRRRIETDATWLDEIIAEVRRAPEPRQASFLAERPSIASGSRRFDRQRVTVPVEVRIEGLDDLALGLRDVGSGGLAIVSRQPFAVMVAQFHFTLPGGEIFSVEAETVHCHLEQADPEIQFLSGWRFTPRNAPSVIQALIVTATKPADSSDY